MDYKRNTNMRISDELVDKINNDIDFKNHMIKIVNLTDFNLLNEDVKIDMLLFMFSNYSYQPNISDKKEDI